MSKSKRIGLVVATEHYYMRAALEGICAYGRKRRWTLAGGIEIKSALSSFRRWRPDGIIGFLAVLNQKEYLRLRVPVVNLVIDLPGVPTVAIDRRSIGPLAVEHFRARGIRHFAYVGNRSSRIPDARREGFAEALRRAGAEELTRARCFGGAHKDRWIAGVPLKRFVNWLRALPKPVAILAFNDDYGLRTTQACRAAGLRVPDDVAVLGTSDDHLFCHLSDPPLSSVVHPWEKIGYMGAAMLDGLMRGKHPPTKPVEVPATRVVARGSTDAIAVDDPVVAEALIYIRDHAGEPLSVGAIATACAVSRRRLDRRFRQVLRRSVHDQIARAHIERAKELLENTSMKISQIAQGSGFRSSEPFIRAFRRSEGTTPQVYRRQSQPSGGEWMMGGRL